MKKIIYSVMFLVLLMPAGAFARAGKCLEGDCENGRGTFDYQTGMKYIGDWQNGKEHGRGKMTLELGTTYEGSGTYTLPDGRVYVGEWRDGKPEGEGTESHPIGTSYEGQWHDGLPHGYGTTREYGKVLKLGYWISGEFVGTEKPKELD